MKLRFRVGPNETIECLVNGEVIEDWTFDEAIAHSLWLIAVTSPAGAYGRAVMRWEDESGTKVPVSRLAQW